MSAEQPAPDDRELSRRTALKRGGAVAAAVWVTPVVQVLSVATADAASGAAPPPKPGPPAHVPGKGRVDTPPKPPQPPKSRRRG